MVHYGPSDILLPDQRDWSRGNTGEGFEDGGGEMRAPCGDVREFGEASAFDGPVGCDLWIVPPVLHADVSQMVGEDVHDGLASGVGGFVDDLVHMSAEASQCTFNGS